MAEARRAAKAVAFQEAELAVHEEIRSLETRLDYWRGYQDVRTVDEICDDFLAQHPSAPAPPDREHVRARLEVRAMDEVVDALPRPAVASYGLSLALVVLGLGLLASLASLGGAVGYWPGGALMALGLVALLWSASRRSRHNREVLDWVAAKVESRIDSAFDEEQAGHATAMEAWRLDRATLSDLVARLRRGEQHVVDVVLSQAFEALDFPFEAGVSFVVDGDRVLLQLDLPEIEDLVPETQGKALKSGEIRQIKRKKSDRQALYATAVAGVCLMVAGTALASAPSISTVVVAAYTQRKLRGSARIGDDYIIVKSVDRESLRVFDKRQGDPVQFLYGCSGAMQLSETFVFRGLTPPDWASSSE